MKNAHPIVNARASGPVDPDSTSLGEPAEPIIRLKVQKPLHWDWELTTSADALPVIQLLDKNGRLLVETTGRTAQRARGSFREGLRSHEQFPVDESGSGSRGRSEQTSSPSTSSASTRVATTIQGNRNIDGFSSKFGACNFAPRKSRSDVNVKENRGSRKRHSSEDPTTRKTKMERNAGDAAALKQKYLAGDYLRQQIMDDLRTRSTAGKTDEQIAKDRCRKVKAYLRSRSENLLSLVREEDCNGGSDKVEVESRGEKLKNRGLRRSDTVELEAKRNSRDSETMKPYARTRSAIMWDEPSNSETSQMDRVVRKIKDDMNEEELARIRAFLREKIQRRMNMEQARSRSDVCAGSDFPKISGNAGIKKRYSDYVHEDGDRRNYRTRKVRSETSILRFDPKVLARERLKTSKQSESEKPTTSCGEPSESSQFQRQLRNDRRSRSELLAEVSDDQPRHDDRSQLKRQSSSAERKKVYRKTKSDVLLGQAAAAAMMAIDAESGSRDLGNPPRRIKSQENVERSWREYKERKRSERFRRDSEREAAPEEDDFMSKPRWRDLQGDLCSSRSCKVCQNLRNCVDPLHERDEKRILREEVEVAPAGRRKAVVKVPEDETSSSKDTSSRPGTSLQENYLLVDEKNASGSPNVSKIRARNPRDDGINAVSTFGVNSPDFGYNTIPPKSVLKDYRELYARSNVKKSDTFKIVDGSEEPEERADGCSSEINCGADCADLGHLNGVGSLANKSNEDIARDYFKRVYELLKRKQEEARRVASHEIPGQGDSSSSNYVEEVQRRRQRRRKKSPQGKTFADGSISVPIHRQFPNNLRYSYELSSYELSISSINFIKVIIDYLSTAFARLSLLTNCSIRIIASCECNHHECDLSSIHDILAIQRRCDRCFVRCITNLCSFGPRMFSLERDNIFRNVLGAHSSKAILNRGKGVKRARGKLRRNSYTGK